MQKSFKSRTSSLSYNMNKRCLGMLKIVTEASTVLHLLCLTQILQVESEITPVYFILQFNRRYGN